MATSPKRKAREKAQRPATATAKRIEWLEKRLSEGMRPTVLVQRAVAEWGIRERAVWELVADIKSRWLRESEQTRPVARAEVLTQVDHLIAAAYSAKDLKTVTRAIALKSELHGLRVKVSIDASSPESASISIPKFILDTRDEAPPAAEVDIPDGSEPDPQ